jgi:hypothetical protein
VSSLVEDLLLLLLLLLLCEQPGTALKGGREVSQGVNAGCNAAGGAGLLVGNMSPCATSVLVWAGMSQLHAQPVPK